jgi:sigma-B regulation protein RsbU (phosphoserine phosphatase)
VKGNAMSELSDVLETQSATILSRWQGASEATAQPGATSRSEKAAVLPGLLHALASALRRFPMGSWEGPINELREADRGFGVDGSTQVREYGLLRGVLLALARDVGVGAGTEEVVCIHSFMADAIERGVLAHAPPAPLELRRPDVLISAASPFDGPGDAHAAAHVLQLESLVLDLRLSEKHLRQQLSSTGFSPWEIDLVRGFVQASPALRAVHGLAPTGRVTLEQVLNSIHPEDRAKASAASLGLQSRGGHFSAEYRATGADGRERWLEVRGLATFSPDGTPLRLMGSLVDATERTSVALARQGILDALTAHPFLQVCLLEGPQHIVRLANPAYRREVGRGRPLVGYPVFEVLPEFLGQGFEPLLESVLRTGVATVGQEQRALLDRGGGVVDERYFTFVYQPVFGGDGRPTGILSISTDETEVVQARLRLERQAVELQAKADFERQLIGIVSHDLRNPLSALSMRALLLAEDPQLGPVPRDAAQRIQAIVERMVRLVSDLLDFTAARSQVGLPISPEPTNLHALVRQVCEEVQLAAPDRTIVLDAAGDGIGLWDPARLAQVALNLITNAARYSPRGSTVTVRTLFGSSGARIEVANPGPPIPPEALPHLFEPLQRASTLPEGPGGRSLGLGLYIVKHIVDAHGGSVSVHSTSEAGTVFTVELPLESVDPRGRSR